MKIILKMNLYELLKLIEMGWFVKRWVSYVIPFLSGKVDPVAVRIVAVLISIVWIALIGKSIKPIINVAVSGIGR